MASTKARRGKVTKAASGPSRDEPARKKMRQTTLPTTIPNSTKEDQKPDTKDHKRKLLLSMDYGTKTLSIAARIASSDSSDAVTQFDIFDVRFFKRSYEAEQIIAFGGEDNKRFFWGSEVEKALKEGEAHPENVIQLWKLLLYKDYSTSATVKHLQGQLERIGIHIVGLIATHLKAIVKYAKENIAYGIPGLVEDIETMPLELFLSVPQLWKSPASRKMAIAAKKAGIERVELVREPECAAAFYTHMIKDQLATGHEIGNELIICDIGGGTGDFLRVRYDSEYTDGAKVRLKNTGDAAGALCGSEFVNERFREWLKEQARRETKTFKAMCKQLGISETACLKAASDEFESIKRDFTISEGGSSEYITLRGAQGAARPRWELDLTSADIRSSFDPVILKIKKCINQQRTDRTKTILIPGGFGCSDYLRAQLEAYYKPYGIKIGSTCTLSGSDCPVSRGALLRYEEIRARGFNPNESFGLAQVEVYDETIHKNASHGNAYVKLDPYDGSFIVYERLRSISKRSDAGEPGQAFQSDTWQQSVIHAAQKALNIQLYGTELDLKDHGPIRDGATAIDPLRQGIEEWGPPLEIRVPDLKKLGFKATQGLGRHKGWVYEIRWRLRLVGEGANVRVEWQVAKPGTPPYQENADLESVSMDLPQGQVFRLCEEEFNPSPRSNA